MALPEIAVAMWTQATIGTVPGDKVEMLWEPRTPATVDSVPFSNFGLGGSTVASSPTAETGRPGLRGHTGRADRWPRERRGSTVTGRTVAARALRIGNGLKGFLVCIDGN